MTAGIDVIDAVRADHLEIRGLFRQLRVTTDRLAKVEAFDKLLRALLAHEAAEAQVVRPLLAASRKGERIGERRIHEELQAERLLAKMEALDVDDPTFDRKVDLLEAAVLRHATKEEQQEHPLIRSLVERHRRRELADAFQEAKMTAPTRPMPGVRSPALKECIAVVEHVRDKVDEVLVRTRRA
jgi:hypothetical protein